MLELLFILMLVIGFFSLFTRSSRQRELDNYLRQMNQYRPPTIFSPYEHGYNTPPFYPRGYGWNEEFRNTSTALFLVVLIALFLLATKDSSKDVTVIQKDKTERVKGS